MAGSIQLLQETRLRIAQTALLVVTPLEIMTGFIALEIMDSSLHNSGHDPSSVYVSHALLSFTVLAKLLA